jgi:hypothetical protein
MIIQYTNGTCTLYNYYYYYFRSTSPRIPANSRQRRSFFRVPILTYKLHKSVHIFLSPVFRCIHIDSVELNKIFHLFLCHHLISLLTHKNLVKSSLSYSYSVARLDGKSSLLSPSSVTTTFNSSCQSPTWMLPLSTLACLQNNNRQVLSSSPA